LSEHTAVVLTRLKSYPKPRESQQQQQQQDIKTLLALMFTEAEPTVPLVIGLTGKARHGKSTVGDMLAVNYGFKQLAFADPLKRAVAAMYNVPVTNFYDDKLKEVVIPRVGMSPRRLLQLIGTDVVREHFEKNFWVKIMGWRVEDEMEAARIAKVPRPNIVVTDVRFDNEALAIRNMTGVRGVVIQVDASKRLREQGGSTLEQSAQAHVTEQGISDELVDIVIRNNDTVEKLRESIDHVLNNLMAQGTGGGARNQ
jgi:dephospho-CoA kinase